MRRPASARRQRSPDSVSYTHLDVYKRQLYAYTYSGAYKVGKENVLGSLECGKLADIVVWAVSYTHLDVYKRQPY